MNGQTVKHNHDSCLSCCVTGVSWTAVIVGALVGIGIAFLLNLFNIAIGLSVYSINPDGAYTIAIGGLIGMAIGVIVSMFLSGWVAGYLGRSHCIRKHLGVLYGFTAWCLALLLMVLMTSHMGRYVNAYSNFVSNPTVVTLTDVPVSQQVTARTGVTNAVEVKVDSVKAAGSIGTGAFVIFVLFALGALSSCFGGYCGMTCRECDSTAPHVHR